MMTIDRLFRFQDVVLSKLVEADIDLLVSIINDAYSYQNDAKGKLRTSSMHLRQRAAEVQLYIAKRGEEIVGCLYVELVGQALHFGLLTVIGRYRGSGLAAALIGAVEVQAKQLNCTSVELDYMSLAPWLKKYYEKYGFQETGETEEWGIIKLVSKNEQASSDRLKF